MKRTRNQKLIRKQNKERREIARVWEKALVQAECNVMDRLLRGVARLQRYSSMPTLSDSGLVREMNRPINMVSNRFRFSNAMDRSLRNHTPTDFLDTDACIQIAKELLKNGYIIKKTEKDGWIDVITWDIVVSKPE